LHSGHLPRYETVSYPQFWQTHFVLTLAIG
jgi:hypothetical protein